MKSSARRKRPRSVKNVAFTYAGNDLLSHPLFACSTIGLYFSQMIDSLTSLAFSVQSSRGIYALLLGSGLSTAAGIPTGWDVTIDLIRKVAAATGEECGSNPDVWYKSKYGREANYSELLDDLAKTPTVPTFWPVTSSRLRKTWKRD